MGTHTKKITQTQKEERKTEKKTKGRFKTHFKTDGEGHALKIKHDKKKYKNYFWKKIMKVKFQKLIPIFFEHTQREHINS